VSEKPPADEGVLRKAALYRVAMRTKIAGEVTFPAVPALADEYTETIAHIFESLHRPFNSDGRAAFLSILAEKIDWAFTRSQNATVTVKYWSDPNPEVSMSYTICSRYQSFEETYATWVAERKPPLFGPEPDARLIAVAKSLGPASQVACLDVGAGTGRNSIPLAKLGHPTDAIEPASALADVLQASAKEQGVRIHVARGNFEDRSLTLPRSKYRLIVLAETCSHFRGLADLEKVFRRLSELLEPGGIGLINLFVADKEYRPPEYVRQLSEVVWCPVYTGDEITSASAGLGLRLESEESQNAYEKAHMPSTAWPPTPWYEWWATGRDLFEIPLDAKEPPPVELRWLTFRRS
jgi:2-polyprenyl-3-methyl-5-hydroxy-6-metoxy-1,4-benzoquinol methylase